MTRLGCYGVLLLALLLPKTAPAQRARLDSLLDRETAAAVSRLIDSAKAAGLPPAGLTSLALEGAMRHASGPRVVEAVRAYLAAMIVARGSLGAAASDAELSAGAGAVVAGVSAAQLVSLREARKQQPMTLPLVVLADLVARGVPVDTAARALYVTLAKGAQDDAIAALRRLVEFDIRAGAAPGAAAMSRLESVPGISSADIRKFWPMGRPKPSLPP